MTVRRDTDQNHTSSSEVRLSLPPRGEVLSSDDEILGNAEVESCEKLGRLMTSDVRYGQKRPDTAQTTGPGEVAAGHDIDRLSAELAKTQAALVLRDAELEALRAEVTVTRSVAKNLRRSVVRSARGVDQLRAAPSVWRSALAGWEIVHAWYAKDARRLAKTRQVETIAASGLFDRSWYLEHQPDVAKAGVDPLVHFIDFGAAEGRDPHPLFDSDWYLATYPEVALANTNPLIHYLNVGYAQGFDPNPLFHTAWYLEQNPEAAGKQINALRHYIDHAVEPGRNPNPYFDSAWYLKQNPDVAASGINPLIHYLQHGAGEGRDPHPSFNTQWYLAQDPRIAKMGMSPLRHYLTIGALDGCRPGPMPNASAGDPRSRADWNGGSAALTRDTSQPAEIKAPSIAPGAELRSNFKAIDVMQCRLKRPLAKAPSTDFSGTIGIFAHIFYQDLADEIASHLRNIPFDFRVYISTDNEEKKTAIEASFSRLGFAECTTVTVLPNLGWDIAPFLLGFADEIRRHDICLKIHSKKSQQYAGDSGRRWRNHLFSELLGDRERVSLVVDAFAVHDNLGILMADHWKGVARRINRIGPNYRPMRSLLNRIGVSIIRSQFIEFPSGSMFWFRSSALAPLLDLGLTWDDFAECYIGDNDATLSHAIERSFLFFVASAGYKWSYLPKSSRWTLNR